MKTILLFLLLLPIVSFSQEEEPVQTEFSEAKVFEEKDTKTYIYKVNNGVKEVIPSHVIIEDKVYNYNYGIKEVIPTAVVKKIKED